MTSTCELSLGGHTLRVAYTATPGTPDVRTLPNGDPGYPGDPPEFKVTKVELIYEQFEGESLRARRRPLDITDLIGDLDAWGKIDEMAEARAGEDGAFVLQGRDEPPDDFDDTPPMRGRS